MAQKVVGLIKLQIAAGKATPAPPVGPALGQHGVNIMAFTKEFNERTSKDDIGLIIPVVITVYAGPVPLPSSLRLHLQLFSSKKAMQHPELVPAFPTRLRLLRFPRSRSERSLRPKMPDLNAANIDSAMSMIAGTARCMGVRGMLRRELRLSKVGGNSPDITTIRRKLFNETAVRNISKSVKLVDKAKLYDCR